MATQQNKESIVVMLVILYSTLKCKLFSRIFGACLGKTELIRIRTVMEAEVKSLHYQLEVVRDPLEEMKLCTYFSYCYMIC